VREIKFRGKLLNKDEWVYGYYLQSASTFILRKEALRLTVGTTGIA
jgi:hypothetical protein